MPAAVTESPFTFVPAPPGLDPVETPAPARYLIVRLDPHGRVDLQGNREDVERFLAECARAGLLITLDHLHWCG